MKLFYLFTFFVDEKKYTHSGNSQYQLWDFAVSLIQYNINQTTDFLLNHCTKIAETHNERKRSSIFCFNLLVKVIRSSRIYATISFSVWAASSMSTSCRNCRNKG